MPRELEVNKQPQLPQKIIEEISGFAKARNIEKVILFGSRARGDNRKTSDIDLAVKGGDVLSFRFDVNELAQTLLDFDVVDITNGALEGCLAKIKKDGIVIYEKI